MSQNFFDFSVNSSTGTKVSLAEHKGNVVLVVNVASQCGFTPQYSGLEELFKKFKDKKFVVLGFPCNQFGAQEPGANEEIQAFCQTKFNVSFPIMAKIDVNGAKADPIYSFLKEKAPGLLGTEAIKWNFTKFLVNQKGQVVKRYAPQVEPKDIAGDISALLQNS